MFDQEEVESFCSTLEALLAFALITAFGVGLALPFLISWIFTHLRWV